MTTATTGPSWNSVGEEAAFKRLKDLEEAMLRLGLPDTHKALSVLTRRRLEKGVWDWGIFEDSVNSLTLEYTQKDSTYADGMRLMEEVLNQIFEVKRAKGKIVDLLRVKWTPDEITQLETSLGVVTRSFSDLRHSRTAILLMGLGHIIR